MRTSRQSMVKNWYSTEIIRLITFLVTNKQISNKENEICACDLLIFHLVDFKSFTASTALIKWAIRRSISSLYALFHSKISPFPLRTSSRLKVEHRQKTWEVKAWWEDRKVFQEQLHNFRATLYLARDSYFSFTSFERGPDSAWLCWIYKIRFCYKVLGPVPSYTGMKSAVRVC